MKTKIISSYLILSITILLLYPIGIKAMEEQNVFWNDKAQSKILNDTELDKISSTIDSWKIKQIIWPLTEEIESKSVQVDSKQKLSCIEWLKKFIATEYMPSDLEKNLIAMKNWGLVTEESKQKRLCDVFISRFKKDSFVIQIQESPGNVVIAFSDERLAEKPRTDYRDWVLEIAALILNYEKLKPNPDMKDVYVYKIERNDSKITRITWLIDSVCFDNSRKVHPSKAVEIGASHVAAETNGKFITFRISKRIKGPAEVNYFKERFSSPETSPDPNS